MSMLIEHPRTRPRFIGRYYQWFWYIKEKWPSALGLSIIFLLKPNCVIVVEYTLWFDLFRFCILYFYTFWKYASVLDLEAHWARIKYFLSCCYLTAIGHFPFFCATSRGLSRSLIEIDRRRNVWNNLKLFCPKIWRTPRIGQESMKRAGCLKQNKKQSTSNF